jgi:tRNA_anti-like
MAENVKPAAKRWPYILLAILAALLIWAWPSDNDLARINKDRAKAQRQELLESLPRAVRVQSGEIADAFESNAITAERRFKNTSVLLTGKIAFINTGDTGHPLIQMADQKRGIGENVQLTVNDIDYAATLKRGDQGQFLCGETAKVSRFIVLDRCTPIITPPN